MDYKDFTSLDFLQDEFFVLWVKKPTPDANAFWENWLQKYPNKAKEVETAKHIILSVKFEELVLGESETDEVLSGVLSQLDRPSHTTFEKAHRIAEIRSKIPWYSIAVACAIFVVSFFVFNGYIQNKQATVSPNIVEKELVTKKNPAGVKSKITLPDGSLVHLNSKSEISFHKAFSEEKREVTLKGEAYFIVKENKQVPFIVKTHGLATKALGTSFNIVTKEAEGSVEVSLVEGSVIVTHLKEDEQLILRPNEKAKWEGTEHILKKEKFDPKETLAWTKNILIFKNATFEEVIAKLSDWYGVAFIIQKKPRNFKHYNGLFNGKSLEAVLENLKFTSNIEFEIKGNKVFIQ